MKLLRIALFLLPCLLAATSANALICYYTITGYDWVYNEIQMDGKAYLYMESVPIYSQQCIYSDPFPAPAPGIPLYNDVSYVTADMIDDTYPRNAGVKVSADSRMDNFQVFVNGVPAGGAGGSRNVTIYGLDATSLGTLNDIFVEACSSNGGMCAFTSFQTRTVQAQTTGVGTADAIFPNSDVIISVGGFKHQIVAQHRRRSYDIPALPGNSGLISDKILTSLSFPSTGPVIQRVEDGKFLSSDRVLADTIPLAISSSSSGWIDVPNTTTVFLAGDVNGYVSSSAQYTGSITRMSRIWDYGVDIALTIINADVTVSAP